MTVSPRLRVGILAAITAFAALSALPVLAAAEGSFETVKAKTFDKGKFVFPSDMAGDPVNILFLAMSNDREVGESMPAKLIEWHAALDRAGAFSDKAVPYHFVVMSGVPFFVKGLISGAMRDIYDGKVPLDHSAALFVDDLGEFAGAAGLEVNDRPLVVVAARDGRPLASFEGDVNDTAVAEVLAAIGNAGGVASP